MRRCNYFQRNDSVLRSIAKIPNLRYIRLHFLTINESTVIDIINKYCPGLRKISLVSRTFEGSDQFTIACIDCAKRNPKTI